LEITKNGEREMVVLAIEKKMVEQKERGGRKGRLGGNLGLGVGFAKNAGTAGGKERSEEKPMPRIWLVPGLGWKISCLTVVEKTTRGRGRKPGCPSGSVSQPGVFPHPCGNVGGKKKNWGGGGGKKKGGKRNGVDRGNSSNFLSSWRANGKRENSLGQGKMNLKNMKRGERGRLG